MARLKKISMPSLGENAPLGEAKGGIGPTLKQKVWSSLV